MELIPHDEFRRELNFNFAPMIDFLFLMLSLFATLAISRATLKDMEVSLVELKCEDKASPLSTKQDTQQINLSVSSTGEYKWLTKFEQYSMESITAIQKELAHQYEIGALPQNKDKTQIFLHIDMDAPWRAIAEVIFAVRELGFNAHPVYEPTSR